MENEENSVVDLCDGKAWVGNYPISTRGGLRFLVDAGGECAEFDAFTLELARKFDVNEITRAEAQEIAAWSWPSFKAKIEEQERQREAEALARAVSWWSTNNIPSEFLKPVEQARLSNPAAFNRVVNWQKNPRGLLLYGPTGAGKSRAAFSLIRRLAAEAEARRNPADQFRMNFEPEKDFPVIVRAADFSLRVVALAMHEEGKRETLEGYLWRLMRCAVLLIDDIDKARFSPRVVVELHNVIDDRTQHGRPMIVTTMIGDANRLAAKIAGGSDENTDIAASLVRRLKDFCEGVHFPKGATK